IEAVAERRKTYVGHRNDVFKAKAEAAAGDTAGWTSILNNRMVPAMNAYVDAIQAVVDRQTDLVAQKKQEVESLYQSGLRLLVAIGFGAVALGALLSWLLARSITRPLGHAVSAARTVASGDLTARIEVPSR